MKSLRRSLGIIALIALSYRPNALAQSGNAAAADLLFHEGRSALQAGDYATACPKLTESYRLDPATGTLLALAICHEGQGKQATAWSEYSQVAVRAKREGRADREQAALEKVELLKGKLSYLMIQLSPELRSRSGLRVLRDGVEVGPGSLDVSLPVDAGVHQVQATLPGKQPFSTQVTLAPDGTHRVVVIPLLAASVPAYTPPAAPERPSATPTQDTSPSRQSSWTTLEVAGAVLAGAGVVGLGVGGVFGLHAISEKNASEPGCNSNNQCTPESIQARKDSVAAANRATVAFIAGGVLMAGGATLYIIGQRRHAEKSRYVSATPYALPGAAGLALEGQF